MTGALKAAALCGSLHWFTKQQAQVILSAAKDLETGIRPVLLGT